MAKESRHMTKQQAEKTAEQANIFQQFKDATPYNDLEIVAAWEVRGYEEVEKAIVRARRWLDRVEMWNRDNSGRVTHED